MPANIGVKEALDLIENDGSRVLELRLRQGPITTGQFIPKADIQSPPELSFPLASQFGTYMAVAIDLDAPTPTINILGPILHWIQPGFKFSGSQKPLTSSDPFVANFISPSPPPFSGPHRYLFLLYEQPEGFDGKDFAPPDGKPLGNTKRMRFDLDGWVKKAGLDQPVAANYLKSN
ncbi:MAG: hypothetical protein M1821_009021 [Bathelium mastoideum]|nr:MAG: hypothetical protein M1821_009021 [Bathelium mastoideum]